MCCSLFLFAYAYLFPPLSPSFPVNLFPALSPPRAFLAKNELIATLGKYFLKITAKLKKIPILMYLTTSSPVTNRVHV